MGRPTKFTPEVRKRLLDAIRAGNYYNAACAYAGVSYCTFRNWMIKGEAAKSGKYREFFESVTRAELEAEANLVTLWRVQAADDWRAARDFLSRRFPERWALQQKVDHTSKVTVERDDTISEAILNNAKLAQLATEFFVELETGGLGEDDAHRAGEVSES